MDYETGKMLTEIRDLLEEIRDLLATEDAIEEAEEEAPVVKGPQPKPKVGGFPQRPGAGVKPKPPVVEDDFEEVE